jgi:hypothetical protein
VSLRDKILNADDIESELVEVPTWGVTVEVRSMDARSRTRLIKMASDDQGMVDMEVIYPEMVIMCSHDPETGERIFGDEDRNALMSKSSVPVELLALAAMRVSGMNSTAVDEAGKDSSSTENDVSSSS